MDLVDIRTQIDSIDKSLVALLCKRLELAGKVAEYKAENELPIFVPEREQEILEKVSELAGSDFGDYARVLYSTLFEISRSYQRKLINGNNTTRFICNSKNEVKK